MSAQTRYAFSTPTGVAGGIVDLAPYAIDTFLVENETGAMKFGVGVVQGKNAGSGVALATDKNGKFEGITVNNLTTEYDLEGKVHIRKGAAIGVMRYGRVYARVASEQTPKYGDPVYMIAKESEAKGEVGYFRTSADSDNTIEIAGRFLSGKDATNGVAIVELFNAPTPDAGE